MKNQWMTATLLGALLFTAACVTEEASDGSMLDMQAEGSVSSIHSAQAGEAALIGTSPFYPEVYYTCSDDLFACPPGYAAVAWVLDADCLPYGSSHLITCEFNKVGL